MSLTKVHHAQNVSVMNSSQQSLSRLQGMQEEDGDEAVVGTGGDGEDFVCDFLPDPLDDEDCEVVELLVSGLLPVTQPK